MEIIDNLKRVGYGVNPYCYSIKDTEFKRKIIVLTFCTIDINFEMGMEK